MLYWCESLTARHSGFLAGIEWRVTLQYDKLVVGWWFDRYNQLTSIPKSLGNCTQMDEFNVEGNDITQLPVSQSFSHSRALLWYSKMTVATCEHSIHVSTCAYVSLWWCRRVCCRASLWYKVSHWHAMLSLNIRQADQHSLPQSV